MANINGIRFICFILLIVAFICQNVHQIDKDDKVRRAAWWIGLLSACVGLIFAYLNMVSTL